MTPSDTPPVGGDWVLVPREPTEEMVDAYNGALMAWVEGLTPEQRGRLKRRATATGARQFKISPRQKLIARWSAVLSAAPPPPVGDREALARIVDGAMQRALNMAPFDDEAWQFTVDRSADAILRLLGQTSPVGQWRPIETAPKDGTRVLLTWRSGKVSVGLWGLDEAWQSYPGSRYGAPTYWMPLPDPPPLSPGELEGTGRSVADSGGGRPAAVKSDNHNHSEGEST